MAASSALADVLPVVSVDRPLLVARLLELDSMGALTTAHVRVGAQAASVTERTVWRWIKAAKDEGRTDRRPRPRLELSQEAWTVLGQAGGTVAALYRHLRATAPEGSTVPSLPTVHRMVKRDLEAGRELPSRQVADQARTRQRDRQALADLALERPQDGGAAAVPRIRPAPGEPVGPDPLAAWARTVATHEKTPAGELSGVPGVVLPAGGTVVGTQAVRQVAEALGAAVAVDGVCCVFGDAGRGKTVAVQVGLGAVEPSRRVLWVQAPVRSSVTELRRAVFDALALGEHGRFPHRSAQADARVLSSLAVPAVLVVDEAQRLPVPCLEYLQGLCDHPGARLALVLCGAGSERALRRLPQLASRVVAWQEVPRLPPAAVAETVSAFHPLWRVLTSQDLAWIDKRAARGTFRVWANLTTHLHTALAADFRTPLDRALLRGLFQRLGPPV
ncbi:ATP-binding protein [Kitasatospora putterlickiae]|uniref:ATP-binding protein n=1 Tax=Kitasatospora putterlickiae TaxID=221725 RepID=UPI0031D9CA90